MCEGKKPEGQEEISSSIEKFLDELKKTWIEMGISDEQIDLMRRSFREGLEKGEKFAIEMDETINNIRQTVTSITDYVKYLKRSASCVFPPCPKCSMGFLVPFSFNQTGMIFYKWRCTNSNCGHMIGS